MSRDLSCWGTNSLKVTARTAPVIEYELWCGAQSKSGRMARIVARTAKGWLERDRRLVTTVTIALFRAGHSVRLFRPRTCLNDGDAVNHPLHQDYLDIHVPCQIRHKLGYGVAD